MNTLAIVYHSAHGHTGHIARHIAEGASMLAAIRVDLLKAEIAHALKRLGSTATVGLEQEACA